ncbi:FtsX-like permease family protein [Actinophytocola oryzae]|uniref:FtsX-like permease family protein n=1 Tax=Actinophytocola oryzae TaxID=502181 RepID=A0A4R7W040_9PSEU|nr:FtsX-like permease family protein [Actinophytocola oryzae]TDV55189.1 FtsX-like permease family protein [Actinophytocola oryzae]
MRSYQLAWRVLRVDRRTQVSTTLTAFGVAVATGLVLLLVSLPFATHARAERTLWQNPRLSAGYDGANGGENVPGATVSVATSEDEVDGRRIIRVDVAPLVDASKVELPAGIDRLPAPGEMLQSPELAALAANRPAAEVADRFGARPVGLLGDDALMFPEQLVALVGHAADTMPVNAMKLPRMVSGTAEVDPLLSLLAGVGVVVLLVPSLVLVASASRLTAARRERRLAALRLAGATPAQVTAMVAAETGLAAVAGAVIGVAASPVLHALATWVPWGGGTWYADDFGLPWYTLVVIAVAVPVLVVGAAVLGLRRVVNTPLMAVGGHTRKPLSPARLAIVPLAIALFFWTLTSTNLSGSMLPVLVSLAILMWSPTIVGPWVTSALGGVFTKVWRRPSVLLAGRRLRDDPRAAYRASAGVVLAVFAGSMALTLMPSLESQSGYASAYRDSVLYMGTDPEQAPDIVSSVDDRLARYGLAERAASVGSLSLKQGSQYLPGYVVSCADAQVLLPVDVSCGSKPAIYAPSSSPLDTVSYEGANSTEKTSPLPGEPVVSSGLGMVLVDPALLPADTELSGVDIAVPASDGSREKARTALLAASGGAQVISKEMMLGNQDTQLADLRRVTVIGLVTASVLGGLSAAIATAGSVMDRRRTFGALMAAGTPVRTLSRALRTEAALPALVATVGAGALGTAVGIGLFGLVSKSVAVISPWLAAPVVLGALVALLAASVCTPALKRVRAEPLADE